MAGRPRKVAEYSGESSQELEAFVSKVNEIKHVARVLAISPNGVAENTADFEAYMKRTYFDVGWTLFDFSVLAHDPNTATVFYVLVR